MEHINCLHLIGVDHKGVFFADCGYGYCQLRSYLNAVKKRNNWHDPASLFDIRFYGKN